MTLGGGWGRRRDAKPQGAPPTLTRQKLEQLALGYLNRFDCTASKLSRQLAARVAKLGGHPESADWIAELVVRYQGSGLLDDARFARNLSSQLAARGKSARAISQKLAARGVPGEVTSELLNARRTAEPEAELAAALAYVRRRRLGPFRAPEARAENRQRDLASVARQGFSFEIAKRALGSGEEDGSEDL